MNATLREAVRRNMAPDVIYVADDLLDKIITAVLLAADREAGDGEGPYDVVRIADPESGDSWRVVRVESHPSGDPASYVERLIVELCTEAEARAACNALNRVAAREEGT